MNWKWTDATRRVAYRVLTNGNCESKLVEALEPVFYDAEGARLDG